VIEAHQSHELGNLAMRHLGAATIITTTLRKGAARIGFEQVAIERASEYAAEDADVTLRVRDALAPQMRGIRQTRLRLPPDRAAGGDILFRMERTGVLLDQEPAAIQSGELAAKCWKLETAARSGSWTLSPRLAQADR